MFCLNLILILSLSFTSLTGFAEGGAEAPAAGGEGEAPKPPPGTSETAAAVKADDWIEISSRVSALKAKVRLHQDNIVKFVEEKQHEKDPQKISEIIKSMVEEHKALKKDGEEYNQQSSVLKYRFPEKSVAADKRKYERFVIKSLEQIEIQLTLDAKIKKTLAKTKKQFPSIKNSSEQVTSEISSPVMAKKKKVNTNLTEPIVIEK